MPNNSLHGWTVLNRSAPYVAKDGAIVGATIMGTPNTFLATDKSYGDFVLRMEVWLREGRLELLNKPGLGVTMF